MNFALSKWAAASSDDEDEDEVNSEVEESDDDSDTDSESIPLQSSAGITDNVVPKASVKKIKTPQLSKKERELVRQKELEDLDSILNSLTDVACEDREKESRMNETETSTHSLGLENVMAKKKKKSKKPKSCVSSEVQNSEDTLQEQINASPDEIDVLAKGPVKKISTSDSITIALEEQISTSPDEIDVLAIIKGKLSKKGPVKKSSTSDSIKIALEEAQSGGSKKKEKKKKDKSKFNQASY